MKIIILIIISLFISKEYTYSQWIPDTTQNNIVCGATDSQINPKIISDDNNGGIIVWEDYRNDGDIYIQRISSGGELLWQEYGKPVCTEINGQDQVDIIKDNNGGAFLVWVDRRNGSTNTNIFAQRIDSNGNILWLQNGIPVCQANGNQQNPKIIADGTGGIIVVWTDSRNGNNNIDIYAQRISSDGNNLWQSDGIAICDTINNQALPQLVFVDDDTIGVIVIWEDDRNSAVTQRDIYSQRIDLDGNAIWQSKGIIITDGVNQQRNFKVVKSSDNNFVILWEDYRSAVNSRDIWAQKFDKYGNKFWNEGINLTNRTGTQLGIYAVPDGLNNILITYRDQKNGNWIMAQKLNADGNKVWADSGIVIGTISTSPVIINDGFDNALILFEDGRNSLGDDIYANKLSKDGNYMWNPNGVPVSTVVENQGNISAVSDDNGGAIVVWEDYRSDTSDIYASRIFSSGLITHLREENDLIIKSFELMQNYPNPFNPATRISWQSPVGSRQTLKVYDMLGNEVATLVNEYREEGRYEIVFDAARYNLSSGVYFYKLTSGEYIQTNKMMLIK